MERLKLIAISALGILALLVVLQNTEQVETRLLFWSISMPRAVLLFGTSLIGFAAGAMATFFYGSRRETPDYPEKIDPPHHEEE